MPYFNYSANARYEKSLSAGLKGYVQYDIAHKGDMWSDLRFTDRRGFGRSLQPAHHLSSVRFGVQAPNDHWTAKAYITHLLTKTPSSSPILATTTIDNYERTSCVWSASAVPLGKTE